MKFALLGYDDLFAPLLRLAEFGHRHALVAAYDAGERQADVALLAPGVFFGGDWTALLFERPDVLLVAPAAAGQRSERLEQLRRLTQAGLTMLLALPACDAIDGFELEMIRRDTAAKLLPHAAGWRHPLWSALERSPVLAALGPLQQVAIERALPRGARDDVLDALTRDFALAARFAGPLKSVSAIGTPGAWGNVSAHGVAAFAARAAAETPTTGGAAEVIVRWSGAPGRAGAVSRLTLMSAAGALSVEMPPDEALWRVAGEDALPRVADAPREADLLLADLEALARGEEPRPLWFEACRHREAAEAVELSLAKGKAIALHEHPLSEQQTFKGLMAVGGCALMLWCGLVLMLGFAADGLPLPAAAKAAARAWPLLLLAPMLLFLLAQLALPLLRLVSAKQSASPHARPSDGSPRFLGSPIASAREATRSQNWEGNHDTSASR